MPLPPSSATLDVDYALLEFDGGVAFPASVHALKQAVIKSRPLKLKGVEAGDLRVYHRGDAYSLTGNEAPGLEAALAPDSDLMDVIKLSPKAFFLLAASLPAGARAFRPRTSGL